MTSAATRNLPAVQGHVLSTHNHTHAFGERDFEAALVSK